MHTEVPVKVNAWVDEGIASLVKALNEFPSVLTLDSCQGDTIQPAYVYFLVHGANGNALILFLGDRLCTQVADLWWWRLEVEYGSDRSGTVRLSVEPDKVLTMAGEIEEARRVWRR